MVNLTANIKNIEELRAERTRLIELADGKEKAIDLQLKHLNDKLEPVHKVLGYFIKDGKEQQDSIVKTAFKSGLKSAIPFLLSSFIGGKKSGIYGAATAVGGELLLKSFKDLDFDKITGFIGNMFKGKDKNSSEPIDWEHEIYT